MKSFVVNQLKNIPGWKTKRKLVVFSVDDYGNVRIDSKKARDNMNKAGLKIFNQFDAYDTLETKEDLESLFEVLSSTKDFKGQSAVFTTFCVPCNIDFEAVEQSGFKEYNYEKLPVTFEKLSARYPKEYEGTWRLLNDGIDKGLIVPQFHGREHLNLKVFKEKLVKRDHEILTVLKNRSYSCISNSGYPNISYTAAFDFCDISENKDFDSIISTGVKIFEEVYGCKPVHFNAPGAAASSLINDFLIRNEIKYSDNPILKKEHLGNGKFKTVFNYTGKKLSNDLYNINRNVVFEPSANRNIDWVQLALNQIEAAFSWGKPAVVSSHRVNFCGHIDKKNRVSGIVDLNNLLKKIINKWPDVEFISSAELGGLISENSN